MSLKPHIAGAGLLALGLFGAYAAHNPKNGQAMVQEAGYSLDGTLQRVEINLYDPIRDAAHDVRQRSLERAGNNLSRLNVGLASTPLQDRAADAQDWYLASDFGKYTKNLLENRWAQRGLGVGLGLGALLYLTNRKRR